MSNQNLCQSAKLEIELEICGVGSLNVFNQHKALLDAMSACVLERARLGLQTTIVKAKSHVDIEGSAMADGLAKEATEPIKYPCHATVQMGSIA